MSIGENIRKRLAASGMAQNELARRSGMSSSGMSTVINGNFEPRMENLRQIAQALGCQVADLLDDGIKIEQEIRVDPLRESIIRDYDQLPPEAQQLVRQYIDLLNRK